MVHFLPTPTTALTVSQHHSDPPPVAAPAAREGVDLLEVWSIVRRSKAVVFGIAACIFLGVMGMTLWSRMTFRASSRLYLGELSDQQRAGNGSDDEFERLGGGGSDVGSEVEILKSRTLVTRAVLDSGLNVQLMRAGSTPVLYWSWLLHKRNPNLLDRAEREVVPTDTNLTNDAAGPRTFRITFKSDREYELWSGNRQLGIGTLDQPLETSEIEVRLAKGIESPRPGFQYTMVVNPLNEVVDKVIESLEVNGAKTPQGAEPVKVVGLAFASKSPRSAATFLTELMSGYLGERQTWKTENATAAEKFVTSQLAAMRDSLDQIEQKLAEYRTKNPVVVLDAEAKAMVEQIGKYEEQRVGARLEVSALSGVNQVLKDTKVPLESFMVGETKDTVLDGMAASLAKSRQQLTELETRFNPAAPNVQQQRQQVEAQQAAIKGYVSGRLKRAQANLGTLDGIIGKFEQKLRTVPGAELGLAQLSRESEVYSNLYSYLLKRQQQTAIVKASTVSKNRVLDVPQVPYHEDSPRLLLRLASAPLGLMVGALTAVLLGLWGGTFQTENDVRRSLGLLPVFGRLPSRRGARKRLPEALASFRFPSEVPGRDWLEACRTLRTNLYLGTREQQRPVVLVTSPVSGDGKTMCVLSLAAMLAADGKAVLVIDADLRNPKTYDFPESDPDLQQVLHGCADWRRAVRLVSTPQGEFHVMGSAEPASAELLSGPGMRDLLKEVRRYYDVVLLDVSSFPETSDALILAPYADRVLSVVRLRNTPRRAALQHFRELPSGVPHAVVLNEVDTRDTSYSDEHAQKWAPRESRPRPMLQLTIPAE